MTSSSDPPFGRALVLFPLRPLTHCLTPMQGHESVTRGSQSRSFALLNTACWRKPSSALRTTFLARKARFEARNQLGNGKKRVGVERIWRLRGEPDCETSLQLASNFLPNLNQT